MLHVSNKYVGLIISFCFVKVAITGRECTMDSLHILIDVARKRAKKTKHTHCVIEMDCEPFDRQKYVVSMNYTFSKEFEAFDGVIICEVFSNGEVYHHC